MYGAILWKTPIISLKELEYLHPENLQIIRKDVVTFDTDYPERLQQLGGIVKRGQVIDREDLVSVLDGITIVGVSDEAVGKKLKSEGLVRRYKEVGLGNADLDIKKNGREVHLLGQSQYLLVDGWQNIPLYEAVDFEKPARSMQVGMMPAKLTQTMIAIGLAELPEELLASGEVTIWDPFVGLGTTALLANAMGCHVFATDLVIPAVKQNADRRREQPYATDKKIAVLKHDATEPIKKNMFVHTNLIVTEGRLGPIVSRRMGDLQLAQNYEKIVALYTGFLTQVAEFFEKLPPIVITIPVYTQWVVPVAVQEILAHAESKGRVVEKIDQPYQRKGQWVARQVVVMRAA